MYIKKLELVNFQVIKEFKEDFEGNVYFITGDNELGKSTLLKAICALLTGERDSVLKNGEEKGFAKMIVGDDGEEYEVELRFTKANPRGTLSIKQKTTGMRSDNVTMLQRIFGYQDFDAVEFSRWSETAEGRRKQIEVVKSLLPENVRSRIAEIDTTVVSIRDKRKDANSTLKTYTTIFNDIEKQLSPGDIKLYTEKKDIKKLMEDQRLNAQLIEKSKTVRQAISERTKQLEEIPNRIIEANEAKESDIKSIENEFQSTKNEVEEIIKKANERLLLAEKNKYANFIRIEKEHKETIASIDQEKEEFERKLKNAQAWIAQYEENDPEKLDVSKQLNAADEYNKKCSLVEDYKNKKEQKEAYEKRVQSIENELQTILSERENLISNSKLPIDGLSFTDDGLELNGVPFMPGKVSDSQIIEVATKLIIASNPTVKVFRIARGESLGEKRLQDIIDIARENGFQGFIEEVKRGQTDLVIEEYSEI